MSGYTFEVLEQARCIAEARAKQSRSGSAHTYRCQRMEGHEGAHEYKNEGRTVTWYGEARKQEDNTRFRFGLIP